MTLFSPLIALSDQRLDLCKSSPDDQTIVKGQIIISLLSRDAITGTGNPGLAIVGPAGDVRGPDEDESPPEPRIPEGWEERRTPDGRVYYVNHVTKTTQWSRPTQPASASQLVAVTNGQNGTETVVLTPPGPSRSSTMTNIEQSPSNGSLNTEPAPGSRRHSTENLIGVTNGEISNSSSSNSIENKTASSPTATTAVSSPRNSILAQNVQLNTLTTNLGSLAIDTSSSGVVSEPSESHAAPQVTTSTTPTTNSSSARIVSKTTNLSPTQQQQVPPNTTAPMNGPPREAGSRSPPTTNLESSAQPGTPQRPAEVIQNRNAADGKTRGIN
jgi:E3 ubiquitin ligase SMURF1/2